MGWKDWLTGGLILMFISGIALIMGCYKIISPRECGTLSYLIWFITALIFYFILGAIIIWIINKRKLEEQKLPWLRGAITGLIISIFILIIYLGLFFSHKYSEFVRTIFLVYGIIFYPLGYLFLTPGHFLPDVRSILMIGILYFLPFIVIGALLGWLYGKIKSKKQTKLTLKTSKRK